MILLGEVGMTLADDADGGTTIVRRMLWGMGALTVLTMLVTLVLHYSEDPGIQGCLCF